MMVNGKKIQGNIAPFFNDDKEHTIEVTLE